MIIDRRDMEEELAALGYDLESLGFWSDQAIEITYKAESNHADVDVEELEVCGLVGHRSSEVRSRIGSHLLCPPISRNVFGKLRFH
jgi:hypothetical protein